MSLTQPSPAAPRTGPARSTRAARVVIVSAWTVPVLVVGQFAMAAVVPVVLVLVGGFGTRLRASRAYGAWAAVLAVTFAVPLVLRATGPDPGLSLSKSMDPVLTAVVVAVSLAVAVALTVLARRRRGDVV